jgi:hypothetical protein
MEQLTRPSEDLGAPHSESLGTRGIGLVRNLYISTIEAS